ncbi:MAG TPA: hypothetical protein VNB90_15085 [Cytophagaceae bacterium]|jgi:hypothetical protein|nr:hypothetical protein [Cytophagaceae bacterium]
MGRLGKVNFQVQNKTDLFLELEVYPGGDEEAADQACMIAEPGFEQFSQYLSGRRPEFIEVDAEGDSCVVYGIFRGENFTDPFTLYVYVEYEEVEALTSTVEQEQIESKREDTRVYL